MGIADRYITKQIFTTTFFAVVILCGVFLMGTIFKQARPLFVGNNPSILLVFQFIASVLPLSLMFMIPCSFLAAILLTFGRMSSDNEITSLRMAGRNLFRIALPVFVLASLFCLFCFWLNTTAAPKSKAIQKQLLLEAVQTDPNKFLDPGVVKNQLSGRVVYVEKREKKDGNDRLFGLHVFDTNQKGQTEHPSLYIYAKEAKLVVDREKKQLRLKLINADITPSFDPDKGIEFPHVGELEPLIFDFEKKSKLGFKANRMQNYEIKEALSSNDPSLTDKMRYSLKNELTHRYAFSLSCLAFAFIGVPLALNSKRKETSTGFVISIGIAVTYFMFFIVAKDKMDEPGPTAAILYWTPNVLAVLIGVWLFRRAQRK